MSAFSQCASDFVHRFAHGAERTIVREHRMRKRMYKIWRAVRESPHKYFNHATKKVTYTSNY